MGIEDSIARIEEFNRRMCDLRDDMAFFLKLESLTTYEKFEYLRARYHEDGCKAPKGEITEEEKLEYLAMAHMELEKFRDEFKETLGKRYNTFIALKEACRDEGIVALVGVGEKPDSYERTYLRGEQVCVGLKDENPYIKCLGTGYKIDSKGNITQVNLSSPGKFSPQEEWGYHHYTLLASPRIEDLNAILNYPPLDLSFRIQIQKRLY